MGITIKDKRRGFSNFAGCFVSFVGRKGYCYMVDDENDNECYKAILFNSSGIPDGKLYTFGKKTIADDDSVYKIVKISMDLVKT